MDVKKILNIYIYIYTETHLIRVDTTIWMYYIDDN